MADSDDPLSLRLRLRPDTAGQDSAARGGLEPQALPELVCDYCEVTDVHGGESLERFAFSPEELIWADRGYSHAAGVAKVLDGRAVLPIKCGAPHFRDGWTGREMPARLAIRKCNCLQR